VASGHARKPTRAVFSENYKAPVEREPSAQNGQKSEGVFEVLDDSPKDDRIILSLKAAQITQGIDSLVPKSIARFLMELENRHVAPTGSKRSG